MKNITCGYKKNDIGLHGYIKVPAGSLSYKIWAAVPARLTPEDALLDAMTLRLEFLELNGIKQTESEAA